MPTLAPDEVARLLEVRLIRLDAEIAAMDGVMSGMADHGMPYLWSVEVDYVQVLRRAERDFVSGLLDKIRKEDLPEIAAWRHAHEARGRRRAQRGRLGEGAGRAAEVPRRPVTVSVTSLLTSP